MEVALVLYEVDLKVIQLSKNKLIASVGMGGLYGYSTNKLLV